MPQGKGTYGSQVGRPSKKRTSFVNDNNWWDKLKQGVSDLRPYNPQSVVQAMEYREGKSMLTTKSTSMYNDPAVRDNLNEIRKGKLKGIELPNMKDDPAIRDNLNQIRKNKLGW